jgi:hypothetical protein
MYMDYSFRYVIIIIKQQCFVIIYIQMHVLLGNFIIKPHTKNILTKYKKLFFFNHNFNRSFNQAHQTLKRTSQKTYFIKLFF